MLDNIAPEFDQRLVGLGIALAIGFIIGLEREWAEGKPVGVRSFALIGTLGGLCGLLVDVTGGWPIAAGLVALGVVLSVGIFKREKEGITTLTAALVVFLLGAAAALGFWLHAIVVGGAVTVLLHWKKPLHRWVDRIGDRDFEIIVRFVLISLVILPVLPDRTYGPYAVFNPFNTWLLVVLIVGMNLAGYVAFRFVGRDAGAWLAGALGGLVSSTATTLSYAGMSRRTPDIGMLAALVILVASTVVYGRVVIELGVVSPGLVPAILGPALLSTIILLGLAGVVFVQSRQRQTASVPEGKNPAHVRQALSFAAIYIVVLFVVAAVRQEIGEDAIYAVALVSGLTDVDALTLSVGQLHADGKIGSEIGWRAVYLATLSNLVFKIGAAAVLGSAELRRWILATGAAMTVVGVIILVAWP